MPLFKIKILVASLFVVLFSSLSLSLPVFSAEFYPNEDFKGENLAIKSTRENVYAAGNKISLDQSEPVAKDFIAAASKIEIKGNVGRSVIAVGGEILINSDRVGGAVRALARNIQIRGNFGEELILAGEDITITDSVINGDLIIIANRLEIKNSQILGDAKISYTTLDGDLDSQVLGEINARENNQNKSWSSDSQNLLAFLAVQFSVIIFLLTVGYFLSRKKALVITEISLRNGKFALDILLSLGLIILAFPALVLSIVFQLYPLMFVIFSLIYLIFILTSFLLPIYVANLVKSTFKLDTKISYLVVASYLVIVLTSLVPGLNILSFLIFFILQLANNGFLIRKFFATVSNSLDTLEPKETHHSKTKTHHKKSEKSDSEKEESSEEK